MSYMTIGFVFESKNEWQEKEIGLMIYFQMTVIDILYL